MDDWEKNLEKQENELKPKINEINEIKQNIKSNIEEIEKVFKKHNRRPEKLDYYLEISQLEKVLKKFRQETFYLEDKTKYNYEKENIKKARESILKLLGKTKVEIFYELDKVIYSLQIGEKGTSGKVIKSDVSDKFIKLSIIPSNLSESSNEKSLIRDLKIGEVCKTPLKLSKHFFYTIAISYSHYGLNAKKEGLWLNDLFHKDDSYQPPLVINPMRTNGNIDINKENDLANQASRL